MTRQILRSFVPNSIQPVKLQARSDGELPLITGYGAVFYRENDPGTEYWLWNSLVERIANTAFDRAVKEDDVRALFNHDPNHLLGRTTSGTLKLSVDQVGLQYEIVPPDTQAGRDTVESIKRGDLTGSSFSFSIMSDKWEKKTDGKISIDIRTLLDVQMYDVGPVTFPAYTSTSTGVRQSLRCIGDNREQEAKAALKVLAPGLTLSEIDARCREVAIRAGIA